MPLSLPAGEPSMPSKPESIWVFRAAAVQWLRYEVQCSIVAIERGISLGGTPDVIGLTPKRFVTEIEIKRTVADFKRNAKKLWSFQRGRSAFEGTGWERARPRLFYFLVPLEIVEKVQPLLEPEQGLMAISNTFKKYQGIPAVKIIRKAVPSARAKRLTVRQCVQMAKHQTGTLSSLLNKLAQDAR